MKPRPSLASIFGNAETGGVAGWCDADRLLSEPPPPPPKPAPKPAPKASSFPPLQMTAVRRFVGVGDHRRRFVALAGAGALLLLLVGWASAEDASVAISAGLAAVGEEAAAAVPAVPVEPVVNAPVKEAAPAAVVVPKQDEPKQDAAADVARSSEDAKPKPKAKGAFDRDAARNAVFGAAGSASACKVKGGPTGRGKASVTIGPSGSVVSVSVSGPFGGKVGSCLNRVFRSVRVPPFEGSPVTLSKTFTIR